MTTTKSKRRFLPWVCLLIVSILFGTIAAYTGAKAETSDGYTDVLADLGKDEKFDVADYPEITDSENDTFGAIRVIQIAESKSGELFVYTYQPSETAKSVVATEVNMSLTATVDDTKLYPLILLNKNGVFGKYVVEGVTVSSTPLRYYNMTSIYRAWDNEIDGDTDNDNTGTGVSFQVGQQWTAYTVNGNVHYSLTETETVPVTSKWCGTIRYYHGFSLFGSESCDSHFVAFKTDHKMDELLSVTVSYTYQTKSQKTIWGGNKEVWTSPQSTTDTLFNDDTFIYDGGLFGKTYERARIVSVDEFLQNEDLTADAQQNVSGKQWVLRFYETPYQADGTSFVESVFTGKKNIETKVNDVTLLRFEFKLDGQVYNLGVVDNKQSADDNQDNEPEKPFYERFWNALEKVWNWSKTHWKWIVGILIGVIVFSLVVKFIRWLFD